MKRQIASFLLVVCAGAAAAQPYSQSMAECAGLYAFGRDYLSDGAAAEQLAFGQAAWLNAAIVQAESEGMPEASTYVHQVAAETYATWDGRGRWVVFSEDFRDWTGYCRKFAGHMGVDLRF